MNRRIVTVCALALPAATHAQSTGEETQPAPSEPTSNTSEGTNRTTTDVDLTIGGYVEAFYQWNFNEPSNRLTNFRGFDNRHNSFTLSNVVLDAAASAGAVSAKLALQFGHTPSTYYLAEPVSPGSTSVAATDASVWSFLQVANVGYRAPIGRGLLVEAGLFLSPIGPEGIAVKDQWNWSRSDLFFGLPFYHTGARVTYPLTDELNVTLAGYNGWNSVVDNNSEKSVSAQLTYAVTDSVTYQLLYFGGVERQSRAPEGRAFRHLFDSYLALYPTEDLSLLAHVDAGFEPNRFGTSWWAAGALYGRVRLTTWLYLALRGDLFGEEVASNQRGTAAPIFWPVDWVASGTATVELRPADNVSMRLEYRHDGAADAMFFAGRVQVDARGQPLANAAGQDNLTVGMVAWF